MNGIFRKYFIFTLHFIPLILLVTLSNWVWNKHIENKLNSINFLYMGYYIGCVEMGERWNENDYINYCKDSTTVFKNQVKKATRDFK